MLYVSLTVPRLDSVSCSVPCTAPSTVPKFSDVGYAASVLSTAAFRFNTPAPPCETVAGTPSPAVARVALLISRDRYCATVSPGRAAFNTAAAPAARGVEKLVPAVSMKPDALYDSPLEYEFCAPVTIASPTATMSGFRALPMLGPRLEKSVTSVAVGNAVAPEKSSNIWRPGSRATRDFRSRPAAWFTNK